MTGPGVGMSDDHRRPDGVDDATIAAVGAVSEALEWVERARGHLYSFHQLIGHADLQFGTAAEQLRSAGHGELADALDADVVGRNVVEGRWTFQMVEEFDEMYYSVVRRHEQEIRDRLQAGRRHVFEAEMKERRRTHGRRGHEATP